MGLVSIWPDMADGKMNGKQSFQKISESRTRNILKSIIVVFFPIFFLGCAQIAVTEPDRSASNNVEPFQIDLPESSTRKSGNVTISFPENLRKTRIYQKSLSHGGAYYDIGIGDTLYKALDAQSRAIFENVYFSNEKNSPYPRIYVKEIDPLLSDGQLELTVTFDVKKSPNSQISTHTIISRSEKLTSFAGATTNIAKHLVFGSDLNSEIWDDSRQLEHQVFSRFNQKFLSTVTPLRKPLREVVQVDQKELEQTAVTIEPESPSSRKRTALIIGNAAYTHNPLKNPENDARDLARLLSKQGFKVLLRLNSDQQAMETSIREFSQELKHGGIGLFYYAGHGVQIDGANYLIPVSSDFESEADAKYGSVNVNMVLDEMGMARNGLNMVILDACRDNPFPKSWTRSATRGLTRVTDSPQGTFIAYSTEPGNVSLDGSGRNGLFTKHLLKAIQQPGRQLELVFKDVLIGVKNESRGKQVPWSSSSFHGDFVFQM